MRYLVYSSQAARPFSEEALAELLALSRRNNSAAGITGMLLYRAGRFLQAIEGDEAALTKLFERIAADPRHTGIRVLDRGETERPEFPDWSMGFEQLDEAAPPPEGFSDFFERRIRPEDTQASGRALRYLQMFRLVRQPA